MKTVFELVAADIMTKQPITIQQGCTLKEAYTIMQQKSIHHLLVINESERVTGILSDRDILKFTSPFVGSKRESHQDRATMEIKVESIMGKKLLSVYPDASLEQCLEKMLSRSIHSLLVIDETFSLKGFITSRLIYRAFLDLLKGVNQVNAS